MADYDAKTIVLYTADPTAAAATGDTFEVLKADRNGIQWIRLHDATTPINGGDNDSATLAPTTYGLNTRAFLYAYDPSNNLWDRVENTDVADNTTGGDPKEAINVAAFPFGIGTGTTHYQQRAFGTDSDAYPVLTNAQRSLAVLSHLVGYDSSANEWERIRSDANNGDSVSSDAIGVLVTRSSNFKYNGNSWDRVRNNQNGTIFASSARTATHNSSFTNYNHRGMIFIIDISAIVGGNITVTIRNECHISGNFITVLTSPALSAVGTYVLSVYPGITPVANQAASDVIIRVFNVLVTHSTADSKTYSISTGAVL